MNDVLRNDFSNCLSNIYSILRDEGYNQQAKYIQNAIYPLTQKDDALFKKRINSSELWGGSGSTWEVDIRDRHKDYAFKKEIVELIRLMEESGILRKGIKSIRKAFEKSISEDQDFYKQG